MAVSIRIKPGIVDRLRETRGIASEEAFARLVGSDRTTIRRVVNGAQPSGTFMANFCDAFGMGLGEVFDIVRTSTLAQADVAQKQREDADAQMAAV